MPDTLHGSGKSIRQSWGSTLKSPSIQQENTIVAWHALGSLEAVTELRSGSEGLSAADVVRRRAHYGQNILREPSKPGRLRRFLLQFHNVLIYVLLVAAVVTGLLGHTVDAAVIVGVVLINALFGFLQEGKAEHALESIRQLLTPQALALRDGEQAVIAASELVPGDVVLLQAGDHVPADLRLIWSRSLQVDEAVLTGESGAVHKHTEAVLQETPLSERFCMCYAGTLVTVGQGRGVVTAIGADTEVGKIGVMLRSVEHLTTPLLRQMAHFARWLTIAILGLAGLTFFIGAYFRHYDPADLFMAAVGLAVAAIPEGLPAVLTITLAIGVQAMARQQAIVRRLPAIETLSSVTVICTDKTGTLTRNEMRVRTVVTANTRYAVDGVAYEIYGQIRAVSGAAEDEDHVLPELARGGLLCNDADVVTSGAQWSIAGDPTEAALVVLALKVGLQPKFEREQAPRKDVIPFETAQRCMASLHGRESAPCLAYVKGAPEQILKMCRWQRVQNTATPLDASYWQAQIQEIARHGERTLAVAFRELPAEHQRLEFDELTGELTLLGLFGIVDPPRPEALLAVRRCRDAGIRIKMITGDHVLTASAIAAEFGIGTNGKALSGPEIEVLSDDDLRQVTTECDVFARVSAEHKLRIVQALQAQGRVVAMTGDGVNDAPALKQADIGIAMGMKGTDAAKEAAELVLADDNFTTVAEAVEAGRTVYDNIKKAIVYILPTSIGEALLLVAAIVLGEELPITPVQILWVNLITTITLSLSLAFEAPERDVMRRAPRDPDEPLLSKFLVWRVVFVSLIIVGGTFGLYNWHYQHGDGLACARTVAVTALVMFQIFYLFNARYLYACVLTPRGLSGTRWMWVAILTVLLLQGLFVYAPPMQFLFGSCAIDSSGWPSILSVSLSLLLLVELEKGLLRLFDSTANPEQQVSDST